MKRNNLSYIISYIFAIVLIFLGMMFYRQSLLIILLLLMLLLPFISIAVTKAALAYLSLDVRLPSGQIQLPHDLIVHLTIENRSIIPLLNCKLLFHYENQFLPNPARQEITLPAEARHKSTYRLPFQTAAAGMFLFDITEVLVTDFLHFYSFRLPYEWHGQLPILPAEKELPEFKLTKAAIEAEDSVPAPDGELTNDLLQLREYQPGDRLKDIHWKMTAKTDELMVKEYDRAKDLYYLLLPELDVKTLQDTISAFYNLGLKLLRARESFRVAVYQPAAHSFSFHKVNNEDELLTILYALYMVKPEVHSAAYARFMQQYPDMYGVIRIAGGNVLPPAPIETY
ncbi:MAG: DUF58 domain-containing protein [Lachnospiraceae bacterium]|nr:DUF58 domain-containing protein [Lachnospiraceae bacterium]